MENVLTSGTGELGDFFTADMELLETDGACISLYCILFLLVAAFLFNEA